MGDNRDNIRGPASLFNVIIDMIKPSGVVSIFVAAMLQRMSTGSAFDPFEFALYLVYIVLIVSLIYFVLWILPPTLRVIMTWSITVVISLLSMSWCLNNEATCRTYFVYTDEKVAMVIESIKDTVIRVLNITHDKK